MADVYCDPEKFGLEVVANAELSEPCYSFDMAVVWYSKDAKKFYWGQDSGCSCPSPFEGVHLIDLSSGTKGEAVAWLKSLIGEKPDAEEWEYDARDWHYRNGQVTEAIEKVVTWNS